MMNILNDPDQPDKDECPVDQWVGPGEKDTWVQLVISLTLGLSAFLAFCVCLGLGPVRLRPHGFRLLMLTTHLPAADAAAAMEIVVCSTKATIRSSYRLARPARQLLRMGPCLVQDHRPAAASFGRT